MFASPIQLLIVGVLVLLLFGGRGKISAIMGDVAKGITSFKKGLKEDPDSDESKADEAIDVTPPKDKQE
ncbi:MAG TPA: Sec-independent protein translocase TatA [Hellea balneolensis]|uniref:Sec-independent protein translocase protein TatA n=1 Tax=Hellea balneolensis TaxID=287478 RepID=A0A7C5LY55_9PROT|nr:Sec-independent protein translocase TatA [Hellea balneolensis]